MGLLKSVDNAPGIDYYEYRDGQYYNKYDYRLRAKIPCARYTWFCRKPEDLDKKIMGKGNNYGTIRKEDKQTVIDNISALKSIINLQKEKKQKQISIRIESNTVAVFSNDLAILKDIETEIGSQYNCDYTQVQVSEYAGIKHFVNEPKHKYRVYMKSKRVGNDFHEELYNTIKRNKSLYPSPAFKKWMTTEEKTLSRLYPFWKLRWLSAAYFIDYDDESTLSYLALMHGEVLGKKYKLEKRPDNI